MTSPVRRAPLPGVISLLAISVSATSLVEAAGTPRQVAPSEGTASGDDHGDRRDSEAPAADEMVPPRLIEDRGAAYPRQALGERFYKSVQVGLVLTLDAT